ncbi:MAG: hypothetical protein ACQESB_00515 [Elusimicrobiota bacterium]
MKLKFIIIILVFAFAGCTSNDDGLPPARHKPPDLDKIEEPEKIKIPEHTYAGTKYSSPFTPQAGSRRRYASSEVGQGRSEVSLDSLVITGIISGSDSKYAILSSGDEYYIARDGLLLDEDEEEVPGVATVVKEDEIILMDSGGRTVEIEAPQW